jgi:hypothetical protein
VIPVRTVVRERARVRAAAATKWKIRLTGKIGYRGVARIIRIARILRVNPGSGRAGYKEETGEVNGAGGRGPGPAQGIGGTLSTLEGDAPTLETSGPRVG